MLVKILKTFPYSADGMTTADVKAGTVQPIRDDLIEGLEAAGYVALPDGVIEVEGPIGPAEIAESAAARADVAEPTDPKPTDPFDHDGDGKPGGSLPRPKRGAKA